MSWRTKALADDDGGASESGGEGAGAPSGLAIDPREALGDSGEPAAASSGGGWRSVARSASADDGAAAAGDDGAGSDSDSDPKAKKKKKKKSSSKKKKGSKPRADGGDGSESDHDEDGAATANALDPHGDEAILAKIRAASLTDASENRTVRLSQSPTWLLQWADLKLLTSFEDDPNLAASDVVARQCQLETAAARELAHLCDRRMDGGTFGVPAREIEGTDPDPSLVFQSVPAAESAFWHLQDSARETTAALHKYLTDRGEFLAGIDPLGPSFQQGADGSQAWPNLDLSERIRKLTCSHFVAQDLCGTASIAAERHDSALILQREYFSSPSVHSTFVCGKRTTRPENNLLKLISPFSPPDASGHARSVGLRRVISVNVGLFRIADHSRFWPEMAHVSTLLGAYTRYRLLTSNLLPEKGRAYYQQLQLDLRQAHAMLVQEVGPRDVPVPGVDDDDDDDKGSRKSKKKAKKKSKKEIAAEEAAAAAGAPDGTGQDPWLAFETEGEKEAKRARLIAMERDLATVEAHLVHAVDTEKLLLEAMWRAWGQIRELRTDAHLNAGRHSAAADAAAAAEKSKKKKKKKSKKGDADPADDGPADDDAVATAAGDGGLGGGAGHHPPINIDFALRGIHDEGRDYADGDDVLEFKPVLMTVLDDDSVDEDIAAANGIGSQLPTHVCATVYARHSAGNQAAFVGRTSLVALDSAFSAGINAVIEMHTTADPHEVIVEVSDQRGRTIATFKVPPALASTSRLLEGPAYGDPRSSVQLTLSTSWMTASGLPFEAIEDLFLRGEADPLDPRNAPLLAELRKRYGSRADDGGGRPGSSAGAGGASFKSGETDIAPKPYELRDERLRLLKLRDRLVRGVEVPANAFEAKLMEARIPGTEFETKQLVRQLRLRVMEEEAETREAVNTDADLALAARDDKARQKVLALWHQKLKAKRLQMKPRRPRDEERLAEIINVPPAPTIGKLIESFVNWAFVPKSKLRPEREDIVEGDVDALVKKGQVQIVVHAMKAEGMPLRMDGTPCDIIAELTFVAFSKQSSPQHGPNPSWFETLAVPFKPPDFDTTTLSIIEDSIVINFYDQIAIDLDSRGASSHPANKTVQFRQERRYLGSVEMPFYSVFESETSAIQGQFTVATPRLIMGYTVGENAPTATLYFSVWPPLPTPSEEPETPADLAERVRALYPTPEQAVLYDAAFRWTAEMNRLQAGVAATNPLAGRRVFFPFVSGASGEPVLITRYLLAEGSAAPSSVTAMPQAIRFVSLLPFVVDLAAGEEKDVWSTVPEYFKAGGGDYEELAIILVHLLRKCTSEPTFLVIGTGDVYKEATFVLTIINGRWMIIDPRIGDVFPTDDPRCGLSEVSMVVSHNQVWGNRQLSGTPYRMVWNLDDARAWKPLFTAEHDALLSSVPSVQRASFKMGADATPEQEATVETDVKRKLQNLLREWRDDRGLRFDKGIARYLRSVLVELEKERNEFASFHQPAVDAEQNSALNNIIGADFQAIGYPVQRSYVTLTPATGERTLHDIFRAVHETAVHEVGAARLRYAVATYVKGYTKDVFAVWAYVVALVPTR